jgi:serralysin
MKRNLFIVWWLVLLAVQRPWQVQALTTNATGLVNYQAFDGTLYLLEPWVGRNVAILTPTNQTLSTNIMGPILIALDAAWDFYQSSTPPGRQPAALPSTTLFGRDTIAVVNSTCGAGCSYLGYTGTEILNTYFQILYNGYRTQQQFDQVLFYELGRTFWFYDGQLDYHPPDVDPCATGFAVYMRFLSMDAAGVAGGPFNGVSFTQFRMDVTNLFQTYVSNRSLNWSNTFRVGTAPSNPLGLGTTDLFASLLMRIGRDFGGPTFGTDFWKQVARRSVALHTTQEAVDNFVLAACATVSKNLTGMFTNTWKFPVSTNAIQEALQRFGQPVVEHPLLSPRVSGTNIVIQWQTEPNTTYQLQESLDLTNWSDSGSVVNGGGAIWTVPRSFTNSLTYYRLKLN